MVQTGHFDHFGPAHLPTVPQPLLSVCRQLESHFKTTNRKLPTTNGRFQTTIADWRSSIWKLQAMNRPKNQLWNQTSRNHRARGRTAHCVFVYLAAILAQKFSRLLNAMGNLERSRCFCDFLRTNNVPTAVLLSTGTFVTENRGDMRLRFLVLSGVKSLKPGNTKKEIMKNIAKLMRKWQFSLYYRISVCVIFMLSGPSPGWRKLLCYGILSRLETVFLFSLPSDIRFILEHFVSHGQM